MVGFCDLVGSAYGPVSKNVAVKVLKKDLENFMLMLCVGLGFCHFDKHN